MLEKGYLIRTERGFRTGLDFMGATIHYDATNPEARNYLWSKAKKNYYDKGIKVFWLDEAEPEYTAYDFDNYRYYPGNRSGNRKYLSGGICQEHFMRGWRKKGRKILSTFSAAHGQEARSTALLSGPAILHSSFSSMRNQLAAGLNMGMAGIPWWTTDIGGFHGGDPDDPAFRELFVRWFQWGTFCPVMRLHGDREPRQPQFGTTGGAACCSGAANEVWSYGEEVYEICVKYMRMREEMREYTRELMRETHETGAPVMRTLFYEFPEDRTCWEVEDEYMYGSRYLVAPVLEAGAKNRRVYLPAGTAWELQETGDTYEGGTWIDIPVTIETMPVFINRSSV